MPSKYVPYQARKFTRGNNRQLPIVQPKAIKRSCSVVRQDETSARSSSCELAGTDGRSRSRGVCPRAFSGRVAMVAGPEYGPSRIGLT